MQDTWLLPRPPLDASIGSQVQFWDIAFMGTMAALALLFALFDWVRSGRPMFLLLFIGGGAMMLLEPMVDTLGGCWFPGDNAIIAFWANGRPIPVWLCLAYFFYMGIGIGVVWMFLRKGLSAAPALGFVHRLYSG
jgi:hypothetical protein